MNISEIFKQDPQDKKFANSFRRSLAATIDIWIVLFLRITTAQILGTIWMKQVIADFISDFSAHFGTEDFKGTQEHLEFVINHKFFICSLIFYSIIILVGAVYHAYLNSSAWRATIGKRLMKIEILKESEFPMTFGRGLMHYFLSVLPFVFIIYLATFQIKNHLTFFETVTFSSSHVIFGLIFIFWVQIHLFTRKKTTAYDLICNTVLVNGKSVAKWPWSKTIVD